MRFHRLLGIKKLPLGEPWSHRSVAYEITISWYEK